MPTDLQRLRARLRSLAGRGARRLAARLDPPATASPAADEALADLRAQIAALEARTEGSTAWMRDLEHGIGDVREAHGAQLDDLGKWLGSAIITLGELSSAPVVSSPLLQGAAPPASRADDVALLRRELQVWTVMAYLQALPDELDTAISVIMPTRDRVDFLRQAVASVLAQRHQAFELVVIDDGSEDATPELLAGLDDPRVRVIRTSGLGESTARNLGLDAARGELVTFLDDDNLMDPGWLHAVAWAFDRWPDTEVLYGARVVEDAPALKSEPSGALPNLDWRPYDRRGLEQANYIDMNTIALRAGLPGCRFDESLHSSIDWQLMLDLTAERDPFELPAVACLYRTYAPNRICDIPERLEHNRRVRARIHRTRPMRVLSHNAMFPLLSETYIHDEMTALERNGARIAFNSVQVPVAPLPVEQPVTQDLLAAVQGFDPDVLVVYWATHAAGEVAHLERVGRPFAVRVHSFDFDPEAIAALQAHPLCVGVWAYPDHAAAIPGAHPLVPLFTSHEALPPTDGVRDLALSVSAGLPKRNWPMLFEALDGITELERGVVLSRSNGFEEVPDEVMARAAALAVPPFVEVNLPRAEVFELLGRTSVLLYTLDDGVRIGMPMSIIEALRAGACVVHPDRPELRSVAGPGYRGYTTVAELLDHVRTIVAGGPEIEAERRRNEAWAREQFCDPALGTRFHEELATALEQWRFAAG